MLSTDRRLRTLGCVLVLAIVASLLRSSAGTIFKAIEAAASAVRATSRVSVQENELIQAIVTVQGHIDRDPVGDVAGGPSTHNSVNERRWHSSAAIALLLGEYRSHSSRSRIR